jgi:hypothetical protein
MMKAETGLRMTLSERARAKGHSGARFGLFQSFDIRPFDLSAF